MPGAPRAISAGNPRHHIAAARQRRFPSLTVYPILPATALELEPGKRASTVWLHARLERDSDGDLGTTKAGFENIADGARVFHLIRELQGKTE